MCLLLVAAAGLANGEGKGEKQGVRLLDAGRLEKFVDELPDMPVLRGYGVAERGRLVAGELTVGMYDTMWVRACAISPFSSLLASLFSSTALGGARWIRLRLTTAHAW